MAVRQGVKSLFYFLNMLAAVAQLVERVLGKDEVMGPNPISSFGKSMSSFIGPEIRIDGTLL
jgi:hypothetical protein